MIRLEVRAGRSAGRVFELGGDAARIGRASDNDVVLGDEVVASHHARLVAASSGLLLEALGAEGGCARLRQGERLSADAAPGRRLALQAGDLIELGRGESAAVLAVMGDAEQAEATVVSMRRVDEAVRADPERVARLVAAQRAIGAASGLDEVLAAVADAALELVPGATHVTMVLLDESAVEAGSAAFIPVLTRVRGASGRGAAPSGPVPVARSVFRKVVAERAAVLAADAPSEVGGSDSLVGASIRSTIGVPLFARDDIVGVVQLDNRSAPAMLSPGDVDMVAALGATASLAVANARLIERLRVAEDRLQRENSYLKGREAERRGGALQVIGQSGPMRALAAQLERVADTRVSVLVEGETGTGKELVAAALHDKSRRRDRMFVTQNCAALPETLLESELFGHRKGAFTGATEEKKGLFEIAHQGTLFLDEVGEMALPLQAKLLRVLQEGEIRPVGSTQVRHVDVRIVAATHRDLAAEVKAGRFREDLFYRLRVFPLRVPPLRERRDDVPLLAAHFLARYSREIGRATGGFAQQTMELLAAHEWPGNVRELQNEVQRLVIQADAGAILTPSLLSPHLRATEDLVRRAGVKPGTLHEMVETVERYLLTEALREHGNNKTNTAKTLGITREGLHKKLRQLGLT